MADAQQQTPDVSAAPAILRAAINNGPAKS